MPNEDRPTGAQVIGTHSNYYQGHLTRMVIPASDPTATFINDVVSIAGSADENGVISILQYTSALTPCGIIVAMEPDYINLGVKYRLPFTRRYAWVNTDPQVRFEIQWDGLFTEDMVGQTARIITSPGSAISGISGMELDSRLLHDSFYVITIEHLSQRPNNSVGLFTKLICSFTHHQYGYQIVFSPP
jgi:hypothetical protein